VMTYYNPFDGTGHPYEGPVDLTLLGADGTVNCAAAFGNPANMGLNDLITCFGAGYGAQVVDVYPLFDGNALALTHIAKGDIHANNDGYAAIAAAFVAAAQ
ncbi:MAG: hypothetical protein HY532_02865, partial [Chloroflexi bacterium]|nr:hypothetical protein [Chloroflexota bacterium]